ELVSRAKMEWVGDIQLLSAMHSNLDDAQVVESAWSLVKSGPVILVIVNSFGENAQFVLARSEQLSGSDFNNMLRMCPGRARGGGKPHFVTGIIDSKLAEPFVDFAVSAIKRELSVG